MDTLGEEECCSKVQHVDAARSSRVSVQFSGVLSKNSSGTPHGHHNRTHCDPDVPLNSNNGDTTTRSALGEPANYVDTSEDGERHRKPVSESNGVPNRNFVTLAMTEQRGHGFSDSESDGDDSESDDDDSESDGDDSESDDDDGEGNADDSASDGDESDSDGYDSESDGNDDESGEEADESSASRDEGGSGGGIGGGNTSDEEDEGVDGPYIQEVDGDSDGSWSSWSLSSLSRSSASSRSSDCGSSSHNLSFSSLGSHGMRRWKSRRVSFSAKNGRRCLQPKKVEANVQARDGALLSKRDLVEEQTMAELRERLRANRLELSRERFHLEVVKQEEAQTRQQLTSKYETDIEKLRKKVRDQDIFRGMMLYKLAEYEDDELESLGRGPGKTKRDDTSAELEALQRSNVHLITEFQDLRQKYQAQSVALRQEREALADARKALESK